MANKPTLNLGYSKASEEAMKFSKDFLLEELDEDPILETIESTGRWTTNYRRVFEFEGKFYETYYRCGSTEMQDERPYEYASDEIECSEVFAVPVTVIEYQVKK